jgi:hypothetical protein
MNSLRGIALSRVSALATSKARIDKAIHPWSPDLIPFLLQLIINRLGCTSGCEVLAKFVEICSNRVLIGLID